MSDKVIRIKSALLLPAIFAMLEESKSVRMTVTGSSMSPFLREGVDSVNLVKFDYKKLKRGDVVLALCDDGIYAMHRIIKKTDSCFYMAGDAQQHMEGPLKPMQFKAFVESVWRGERYINCNSLTWTLLSAAWLAVLPFRWRIIRLGRKIKRVSKWLKRLQKA